MDFQKAVLQKHPLSWEKNMIQLFCFDSEFALPYLVFTAALHWKKDLPNIFGASYRLYSYLYLTIK